MDNRQRLSELPKSRFEQRDVRDEYNKGAGLKRTHDVLPSCAARAAEPCFRRYSACGSTFDVPPLLARVCLRESVALMFHNARGIDFRSAQVSPTWYLPFPKAPRNAFQSYPSAAAPLILRFVSLQTTHKTLSNNKHKSGIRIAVSCGSKRSKCRNE